MSIPFIIFLLGLILVIVFFKNFYSAVYFVVIVDIFLRIVTYLKVNILRDDAFGFLNFIPADVPSILNSLNLGAFEGIFMALYIIVYIVFEGLIISTFFHRKL